MDSIDQAPPPEGRVGSAAFSTFSTNPLPDLSFSFKPKPFRLAIGDAQDCTRWEGQEMEIEEIGKENPFELDNQLSDDDEEEQDGRANEGDAQSVDGEDDSQIVGGGKGGIGRDAIKTSEKVKTDPEESNGGSDRRGCDEEGAGPTKSHRAMFVDPLPDVEDFSHVAPSFSTSPHTPPPQHDVTGRLLPPSPPPFFPFDISLETPPRSPSSRFGSSTKSISQSLGRCSKQKDGEAFWDSTLEFKSSSLPSTPQTSPSKPSVSLPPFLPLAAPNSLLGFPPRSHSPVHDSPPSHLRQSLATRRNLPIPFSPFVPVPPCSPPPPAQISPRQRIDRTPSGYYRLPLSPTSPARSTDFPLPPPPPPLPASATCSTTGFPFPSSPSFPRELTRGITPSFPQTPTTFTSVMTTTTTTKTASSFEDLDPSCYRFKEEGGEGGGGGGRAVPRFVSIFVPPTFQEGERRRLDDLKASRRIREEKEEEEEEEEAKAGFGRRMYSTSSSILMDPIKDRASNGETRHRRTWTLGGGGGGGGISKQSFEGRDAKVENWLKGIEGDGNGTVGQSLKVHEPHGKRERVHAAREKWTGFSKTRRGKLWIATLSGLLLAAVGIIIGTVISSGREGGGGSTSLNATCVSVGGNSVPQAFLDLASSASLRWNPPIDLLRLALTLNRYVHPSSTSCNSQLSLLEFPSLSRSQPNRLLFSRLALVHTLALTESNTTTYKLYRFISSLPFSRFKLDEPTLNPNSNFEIISGGFTFDFSTMTRTVQNLTWSETINPSEEELERIRQRGGGPNRQVEEALDRITRYSIASSLQRSEALKYHWMDTLGFREDELDTFRGIVQSSEILIPVGQEEKNDIREAMAMPNDNLELLTGIGCREDLIPDVRERVAQVENQVFGLAKENSSFCLNRPIYGVLNLLHLSTPFPSSLLSTGRPLPEHVLVLDSNVATNRLSVHAVEPLSAGFAELSSPTSPSISSPTTIERFGFLDQHIDHVLLDYLNLLDLETARSLVDYLLSTKANSPTDDSSLSSTTNDLRTLPVMEVQLWGDIRWNDIKELRETGK